MIFDDLDDFNDSQRFKVVKDLKEFDDF